MSLTYGFYDSMNHDRKYNAEQLTSIFDGIINDGIFMGYGNAFEVVPGDEDLVVNVKTGRAWFNHTWTLNDAVYPLTLAARDVSRPRIDVIAIQVGKGLTYRENSLVVIQGEYNGNSPVAPTLSTGENDIYQYALAEIKVAKQGDATKITTSAITDKRGQGNTPWVTGIIDTVDAEDLIKQWKEQFDVLLKTLEDNVASTASGNLGPSSIGTEVLAPRAVTYEKLESSAVMIQLKNTTVSSSAWKSDTTYEDYPFRALVPVTNVTSDMFCFVAFDVANISEGIYCPVANTYNGGFYIYTSEKPSGTLTIPTIIVFRSFSSSFA